LDVVTNVDYRRTPLLSGLPKGPDASQTLHEYATATFAAAADNAQKESVTHTVTDHTQPSRANNVTQLFADFVTVSGTEMAVDTVAEAWSYQLNKNLTEHARDIELTLMAGSRASGSSGVARRLAGVINSLTTNATTRASGSSLGEVAFNDILEMIYNAGTDEVAGEIYVGGTLKRDISAFSANSTRNVSADDKRLVNPVDVYESDFGMQKVFLHRDVPNGANAKMLVAINPNYHRLSFLKGRRTKVEKLAKDGDRERAQIISELTIEHRGEKTGAAVGGFTS